MLGQLRQIVVAVDDVDEAIRLFQEEFGLALRFRDGDRYAALELAGLTLALAGPDDRVSSDPIALACKVPEIEEAVSSFTRQGWAVEGDVSTGPHERRALVRKSSGLPVILYQPRGS